MTNIELEALAALKDACYKYVNERGRQQQRVYEVARDLFTRIPLCNNDNMTKDVAEKCISAAVVFVKQLEGIEQ